MCVWAHRIVWVLHSRAGQLSGDGEVSVCVLVGGSQDSVDPPLKGWTVVTQPGDVEVSECVCVHLSGAGQS